MKEFLDMVHDPKHRATFEELLRLAASRGDADLVAERLAWGIDPNSATSKGRTPMIANVRGVCPSAPTIKALLAAGADPNLTDQAGLTALDYARRKLMSLQSRPRKPARKSPSLDENNQLQMCAEEQAELDAVRSQLDPETARDFVRMWYQERLRAARRTFNDADQVESIVQLLEDAISRT